jgi:hypothetical protein
MTPNPRKSWAGILLVSLQDAVDARPPLFSFGVTPGPEWQPQDRIEEPQPFWQRDHQYVGLVRQVVAHLGQPISPVPAEKKRGQAAAGGAESGFVRIVLPLALCHHVQGSCL